MDIKTTCAGRRGERGASAVEYGLLITGIAALIIIVIIVLGGTVFGLFDHSCSSIAEQQGAAC